MAPGYFKVYDDQALNNRYQTLDILEMSDGGVLLLASINNTRIYLLRTNADGEYMASKEIDGSNKNVMPSIIQNESGIFIGCMDQTGLFTRILKVEENSCETSLASEFQDLLYPLAVSTMSDGNLLLLSYDRLSFRSELSKISISGNIAWSIQIPVNQDAETRIVRHLDGSGTQYPFFTAVWNNKPIVNCFSNYSFSFLMYNSTSNTAETIYNGSQFSSGLSSFFATGNGNAAISRFSFGKSYMISDFNQNTGIIDLTDNMGGTYIEDAEENSVFKLGHISVDGVTYLSMAYNTQNGRVALVFLDASGQFKARKYFGAAANPFKIGQFRQTSDKGLLVGGTFYVAGSLPRPALFKLNEKELYKILDLKYE